MQKKKQFPGRTWRENSWQYDQYHARRVANVVMDTYTKLPAKGKPRTSIDPNDPNPKFEWTVLSAIVIRFGPIYYVAGLGSGTGVLPKSSYSKNGELVHDSHAEVLARRAFVRYMYREMKLALKNESKILKLAPLGSPYTFVMHRWISLHLYSSQAPCGDCSTVSLDQAQSDEARTLNEQKRADHKVKTKGKQPATVDETVSELNKPDAMGYERSYSDDNSSSSTTIKPDLNAKNVDNAQNHDTSSTDDTTAPLARGRMDYQLLGALRTKPGRNDASPTESLSCSDKIARWNVLGLNGAIQSSLVAPMYLSSIIIGDLFHPQSLQRAIFDRVQGITGLPSFYFVHQPSFFHTEVEFPYSRNTVESNAAKTPGASIKPSPNAVAYYPQINYVKHIFFSTPIVDEIVQGRKMGTPKPDRTTYRIKPEFSPFVSRLHMLKALHELLDALPDWVGSDHCILRRLTPQTTYLDLKLVKSDYKSARSCLIQQKFPSWLVSDRELYRFYKNGDRPTVIPNSENGDSTALNDTTGGEDSLIKDDLFDAEWEEALQEKKADPSCVDQMEM
ncbi:hypothetical protein SmJEL517_g05543 [Synchytrium microbalum]|uniref:tRNA-specific adenosine deaminase 1 n=1 Tax=Synchytrium microbalum TaxID=1806994 RepID=A0A507BV17_9FUNG|nr:uncharacterized protein SmJEL517_g05543 [Synchytrium microbalum]TPX31031.1 hypothetical protein SmJEL517_g05543 [Synchytrium microbalum]